MILRHKKILLGDLKSRHARWLQLRGIKRTQSDAEHRISHPAQTHGDQRAMGPGVGISAREAKPIAFLVNSHLHALGALLRSIFERAGRICGDGARCLYRRSVFRRQRGCLGAHQLKYPL